MTRQEGQEMLVFAAMCAFLQEDGYSHFSYENLIKCGVGKDPLRKTLIRLEQQNKIINKTENGFYNRYIIISTRKCPDFVFNEDLPGGARIFLLNCFDNLETFNRKSIKAVVKELNGGIEKDSKSESKYNTLIKQAYGKDIFDVLNNVEFVNKIPTHPIYDVIKKEQGYQIDSEHDKRYYNNTVSEKIRRHKKQEELMNKGMHYYLYNKVKERVNKKTSRVIQNLLTPEDILKVWEKQQGKDFYTGESLENNFSASVDRIDSNKDYTIDNIAITTKEINIAKMDLSLSDFIDMCEKVTKHMKNKVSFTHNNT